jgi:hypothetical protein
MSIFNSIIVVIIWYLLSLLFIRADISGIIAYRLNKNARKKRKKGQTFKEWFLYSRYRNEIPKILLVLYFFIILIHPLVLLCCIAFYFIKPLDTYGTLVAKGIAYFDVLWLTAILLLFWSPGPNIPYERWISKKGGNKRKGK